MYPKKRFIFFLFFHFFILSAVYISLFYYQLGSYPLQAEIWLDNVFDIKAYKAQSINKRKIIIISGSNSLFGINTKILSELTRLPVLNLAAHGGLDIDFLYYKIKKYIHQNDLVIMPLEYNAYFKRDGYSEWFLNNMMVWGNDYFHELSIFEKLKFISKIDPERIFLGVKARLENNIYTKNQNAYDELRKLINSDGIKWRGYSYKSSNLDGDINVDSYNKVKNMESHNYLDNDLHPSNHFLLTYSKIEDLIDEYDAEILLTHTVTFRINNYDLTYPLNRVAINNFIELLSKSYGIDIHCNPMLFNLDTKYAFDTMYHPNKYGALIRSENLAKCVNNFLSNKLINNISYEEAIRQTKRLEKKYESVVKKNPVKN